MSKTNLTVRIESELKQSAEHACEYLGLTLTALVHNAIHQVIKQALESAEKQNHLHQTLSSGFTAKFYLKCASREIAALESLGFDAKKQMTKPINKLTFEAYRTAILNQIINELEDDK